MTLLIVLGIGAVALAAGIIGSVLLGGSRNPPLPGAKLLLGGEVFEVELARTILEKARGLSGREGLGENEGMLFVFGAPAAQSFWMKGMKFPIDIIWIQGDRIVGFAENVQPEPGLRLDGVATATQAGKSDFALKIYSSPEPVDRVLEVRAGTVARLDVKIGDQISDEP